MAMDNLTLYGEALISMFALGVGLVFNNSGNPAVGDILIAMGGLGIIDAVVGLYYVNHVYAKLPIIPDSSSSQRVIDESVLLNAIYKPVIDEPVIDDPVIDEPVIDDPVIDEPVIDDPVIYDPNLYNYIGEFIYEPNFSNYIDDLLFYLDFFLFTDYRLSCLTALSIFFFFSLYSKIKSLFKKNAK
jgi:hypothetical protein